MIAGVRRKARHSYDVDRIRKSRTVATVSSSEAALPALSLTTTAAISSLRRASTSSEVSVWLMVPR